MSYIIISNSNEVYTKFADAIYVKGDFLDVLLYTRDLVHKGHKLISSPLGASIRMMYSPVKSILITEKKDKVDLNSVDIIENSILKYKNTLGERKPDYVNKHDYEILDYELLLSAIEENDRLTANY